MNVTVKLTEITQSLEHIQTNNNTYEQKLSDSTELL